MKEPGDRVGVESLAAAHVETGVDSVEMSRPAPPDVGRRERARILLVAIAVLVFTTAAIAAITMGVVHRAVFQEARLRLQEVAAERARLIEAIAQFDARHSKDYPGGPTEATLSQIVRAHESFPGFGQTGELVLGRREGDRIVFLTSRHAGQEGVPWGSSLAEPMRRALRGESGSHVGDDYRGARVLAAHEPIPQLNWGVVAKIDIAEIRASFLRAGVAAVVLGGVAVALGVAVLFHAVSPIITRLERRTRELRHETEERIRAEKQLADARSLLVTSIGPVAAAPELLAEATPRAPPYFRALALDYDGTLTTSGRPDADLLQALENARKDGLKLLLTTGRIMTELQQDFLDVDQWFDLVIAENGAILYRQGIARALSPPVPRQLDQALESRGVEFRRGQVLLASFARYDRVVLDEISRLQLDCQIVRNRGEIMVLPAEVSKGTGLEQGLDALGVSPHNTIAVGDAENDLSMFEHCELGVAVSNAIPSLKAQADVVLDQPAGQGVRGLLDTSFLRGREFLAPKRWRLRLGHTPEGTPVSLPASSVNVLVTGGSGAGKSFATGLIAEELIELGYSICVFDPEGDHVPLGRFRDVFLVGGHEPLPLPQQLARLIQHRFGSVVVDLSQYTPQDRDLYVVEAFDVLTAQRNLSGFPHWLLIDEAHGAFGTNMAARFVASGDKGYCLVTYRPSALRADSPITFDYVLALAGGAHAEDVAQTVGKLTEIPSDALDRFLSAGARPGQALLIHVPSRSVQALTLAPRTLEHMRHWHKYSRGMVSAEHRFFFRTAAGLDGASAGNIDEFCRELEHAGRPTLVHHAAGHDFSRWFEGVIQDPDLAARIRRLENQIHGSVPAERMEATRREMLEWIRAQYLA